MRHKYWKIIKNIHHDSLCFTTLLNFIFFTTFCIDLLSQTKSDVRSPSWVIKREYNFHLLSIKANLLTREKGRKCPFGGSGEEGSGIWQGTAREGE